MSTPREAVAGGRLVPDISGYGLTRLVGMIAAVVGVIALALGGPSLMAALTVMRANAALAQADKGGVAPPENLEQIVESSYASSVWQGDSRVWFAMGEARLSSARQELDDEALQRRLLERAIFAFERGLSMTPSNSLGWMRFGEALIMRAGPSPRAARALKLSVKTGRVAPEFAVERLELLLSLWDLYDGQARAMIAEQARIGQQNRRTAEAVEKLLPSAEGEKLANLIAPRAR
jgi:hypothetical protein